MTIETDRKGILALERERLPGEERRIADEAKALERTPRLARRINDFIERKLPVIIPEGLPEGSSPKVISGPKEMVLECTVPSDQDQSQPKAKVIVLRELVGSGRPEFTVYTPNGDEFYRFVEGRGLTESRAHRDGDSLFRLEVPVSNDSLGRPLSREYFGTETVDSLNELMDRLEKPDVDIVVKTELPQNSFSAKAM